MHRTSGSLRALTLAAFAATGLLIASSEGRAAETAAPPGVVNVNTASAEELEALPGVGESRAKAIVEMRKSRGGFKRVEDLLEVKGIGKSALEKLRPFVTVEGRAATPAR